VQKPGLIVFAGPNGSGKSTLIRQFEKHSKLPEIYINADDITQKLLGSIPFDKATPEELMTANRLAALEAERLRQEALAQHKSFATETVMSTPDKITFMREAKAKGYYVQLEFMNTQDAEINIERVGNRLKKGGHGVPTDKIIARHGKANYLLPEALQVADIARVYNNSFENPVLIMEKTLNKEIRLYPMKPLDHRSKWGAGELEAIKETVGTFDKAFADIANASILNTLSKFTTAREIYNAYAKKIVTQDGGVYASYIDGDRRSIDKSTDAKIFVAMLKNGFSTKRTTEVLNTSPSLLGRPSPCKQLSSLIAVMKAKPEIKEIINNSSKKR
jgi:predicted ABC-type ATPase